MLGNRQIILLVLAILPTIISPVFGQVSINVDFNQENYQTGDLLEISGTVSELSMPVIAMSIYDPNGMILTANNLEIDSNNVFSKIMFLDAPFYEKPGEYKVKLDYGQTTHKTSFIVVGESESVPEEILAPEIILLTTDKSIYTDNDVITITGIVSSMESPTVLVGIYDPFGTPAGFYFGQIDSNFEFSVDFLAKADVNFKTDGIYSIKAHYAESEETSTFEFQKTLDSSIEMPEEPINDTESTSETESETIPDEPQSNSLTESETIDESKTENPNNSIINKQPESEQESVDNSNIIDDNQPKQNNQKQKNIQTSESKKNKIEPEQFDNLTVEDIELGKLLNQINLNCDSSTLIDSITYYDGMGPALYRLCNWEDSLQSFEAALVDEPNNVEIIVNKGSALAKLGYYYEAINEYDKALDLDSSFIPAINNKANALAKLGHADRALNLYAQVIQENPNYITARKNMANILSEQDAQAEIIDVIRPDIQESKKDIPPEPPKEEPTQNTLTSLSKKKETNFLQEFTKAISSLFGFLN